MYCRGFPRKTESSDSYNLASGDDTHPIVGFILYLSLDRHLYGAHIFNKKTKADLEMMKIAKAQYKTITEGGHLSLPPDLAWCDATIALLLNLDNSVISNNNDITVYTDGEEIFAAMKQAIAGAKHHIHMEYFIIRDDELGNEIMALLTKKAMAGIRVRVIFDAAGTVAIHKNFSPLSKKPGGCQDIFPAQNSVSQHPCALQKPQKDPGR